MSLTTFICVYILALIGIVLILAFLCSLPEIIISKKSLKYQKVKELNENTHIIKTETQIFNKDHNSLDQYNKYGKKRFREECLSKITGNLDYYVELKDNNIKNKETYKDYISKYQQIIDQKSNLYSPFRRIEDKAIKNIKMSEPTFFAFRCKSKYTSPAGRNHYAHTFSLNQNEFDELVNTAIDIQTKKEHKIKETENKNLEINSVCDSLKFVTIEEFEKNWILSAKERIGLKYSDSPGCYIFLIFKNVPSDIKDYMYKSEEVYVGQSLKVNDRVHMHISGKGNGDIYADVKNEKAVYVARVNCNKKDLNYYETGLIEKFNACSSYNKTKGGSACH